MQIDPNEEGNDYFKQQLDLFQLASLRASAISRSLDNRFVSLRKGWTQWIHLRLCVCSHSILTLTDFQSRIKSGEECTLDQSSICALARSMVEGAAMLTYISDTSLTEEQWELRKLILWLHDATARYKMFSRWKADNQAGAFRKHMQQFRSKIASFAEFQSLASNRQHNIIAGSEMYINGLRSAVRLMGFDAAHFEVAYNYLSCHAHSSPVSFMNLDKHGVDFKKPTDAQRDIAGYALEIASGVLNISTEKVIFIFSDENILPITRPE